MTEDHDHADSEVGSEAYEVTWFAPDRPVDGTVFLRQPDGGEAGGGGIADTDEH